MSDQAPFGPKQDASAPSQHHSFNPDAASPILLNSASGQPHTSDEAVKPASKRIRGTKFGSYVEAIHSPAYNSDFRPSIKNANRPNEWAEDFITTGANLMGIFSRTRDIIAANFAELLDSAEDPAKMIRMIIMEMEETLVEVRASAARTIADQKEMGRAAAKLQQLQNDWEDKARLALSKDREDLARGALLEKRKAADMAEQLEREVQTLNDALKAYEADIVKLQNRLTEARSRQSSIAARLESAENRVKLRTLMTHERADEALARFDALERRVDYAEGRAEALNIATGSSTNSLSAEISALEQDDKIADELAALKADLNQVNKG